MDETPTITRLRENAVTWAQAHDAVRAMLLIGSLARRDHPGDEWADLDLLLFVTDFTPFTARQDWAGEMGDVWVCIPHMIGDHNPEYLVLYDGGLKVDYAFFTVDELRAMTGRDTLDGDHLTRGYHILVDKDGLAARLPAPPHAAEPYTMPDAARFAATVDLFWYGALYVAKQIRRRQLWLVKFRDWTMKESLLLMIEWHARARNGADYDTWHLGKFIGQWTDAQTWDELHAAFGHFDAADSWRALRATLALFRRLATETAARLGFTYPTLLDERITGAIDAIHAGDTPSVW